MRRAKLPEPWTYFIDRSLGRGVVAKVLRASGQVVHVHDDLFAPDTPDVDWLVEVGRRQWVVLTKDKNIRINQLEYRAIVEANVACIMLGHGNLNGSEMANLFVAALPVIARMLRRFPTPIAATLTSRGLLRVFMAGGDWLEPPKELRP